MSAYQERKTWRPCYECIHAVPVPRSESGSEIIVDTHPYILCGHRLAKYEDCDAERQTGPCRTDGRHFEHRRLQEVKDRCSTNALDV